jgi:16S rRNA C967 or C1407 C5-methylase (RsmB/RsmF family)
VRQLLRVEESGAFVGLVSGGVDDVDDDPFYDDDDDEDDDDDDRAFAPGGRSSTPSITRRQQRVVKDLVAGVTRWQRRLDFVLSQLLAPPASSSAHPTNPNAGGNVAALDPPMRAVLRLALFELTERRLPPHALGDYVALARRLSGGRIGGNPDRAAAFCNGVLRSAARRWEGGDLPLPERVLARELSGATATASNASARREAVRALAAVHSHPAWMVGRWVREWGAAPAEALLRRNNERPGHCLRASRPGAAAELLEVLEREAQALLQEEEEEEEDDWEDGGGGGAVNQQQQAAPAAAAAPQKNAAALAAAAALSAAAAAVGGGGAAPAAKAAPAAAPKQAPSPPPSQRRQPPSPSPSRPQATLSPFLPADFVRLPSEGGLLQAALRSGLVASGLCTVQDEATGLVVRLALAPQQGETILDACAAPGGKALYTSALLQGQGVVVAADASAPRLRALEGTARRLASAGPGGALAAAALVVGPSGDLRDFQQGREAWMEEHSRALPEQYDAVLLDAPCSGTGVLSKRADLRWRRTQQQVERDLPELQDALLDAAASLVKPGGRLVYATCSVERDENDARVEAFLARAVGAGFEVEALLPLAGEGEGDDDDDEERRLSLWRSVLDGPYLRLLPHVHGTDGAFACRLRRKI